MLLAAYVFASLLAAGRSEDPVYVMIPGSQLKAAPRVTLSPLKLATAKGKKRNLFTFGVETKVKLGIELKVPILAGATAEAWLGELSLGNAARVAANQFIPYTDVCAELVKLDAGLKRDLALPAKCPVPRLTEFSFDQVLRQDFWKAIEGYVSRDKVVGTAGVLEMRLWSKAPCKVCWEKPTLLAGVSLPFEIVGNERGGKQRSEL